MRDDEREIFQAMMGIVQGRDVGAASNATMNVLANLIVAISPSLEQAEFGAEYAAGQIKTMMRPVWNELRGKPQGEERERL